MGDVMVSWTDPDCPTPRKLIAWVGNKWVHWAQFAQDYAYSWRDLHQDGAVGFLRGKKSWDPEGGRTLARWVIMPIRSDQANGAHRMLGGNWYDPTPRYDCPGHPVRNPDEELDGLYYDDPGLQRLELDEIVRRLTAPPIGFRELVIAMTRVLAPPGEYRPTVRKLARQFGCTFQRVNQLEDAVREKIQTRARAMGMDRW